MTSRTGLVIKGADVVHEIIDGEAIIFHLRTGVYYSLTGPGVEAWEAIQQGCAVEDIVDRLACRYEAAQEDLEVAVAKLVSELLGTEARVRPPPELGDDQPALVSHDADLGRVAVFHEGHI